MDVWAVLSVGSAILIYIPAVFLLSCVIILAALGKSFGIREFYVNVLVIIFEWGKERIVKHERSRSFREENNANDETESLGPKTYSAVSDGDTSSEQPRHPPLLTYQRSVEQLQTGFFMADGLDFTKKGIQSIIEDDVTQRFDAAELSSWNLLTRTNTSHEFISVRLTILWFIGCVLRYCILFPFRTILALFAIGLMIAGTAVIGQLPNGKMKKWLHFHLSLTCYRIMSRAFSAVIRFHNRENLAGGGGICVANHTSPIDIIILGTDNCYAMVGQAQGGFMGTMQRAMSRAESHIWFQRSEAKDRSAVARRLREHVEDTNKLPILIFPEGTCINNTSIMMFKKGSFEVGGTIYPVAIKYDPRFADPFWNSSKQTLSQHLVMILTSWALVGDVWYLPPQTKRPDEDAVAFANRIKGEIAMQGGLVDLDWDGGLKRSRPKQSMLEKQQEEYSKRLKGE